MDTKIVFIVHISIDNFLPACKIITMNKISRYIHASGELTKIGRHVVTAHKHTPVETSNLHFSTGNAKLSTRIAIFDLPAGWTCPQADKCLCKANPITGCVTDGPNTQFRCYAASLECVFKYTRHNRWQNFTLLKKAGSVENMANLIQHNLPKDIGFVRVHSSGDFFNERYFLAWLNVALNNPVVVFYGYTKTLDFLVKYKKYIPSNFRFTASKGGKLDHLIAKHHLKYAEVVFSVKEAADKGLEIDHNDSHAISGNDSFALLLHGCQPKDTPAATALTLLKRQGLGMYGKGTKKENEVKKDTSVKIHITLKDGEIYLPSKGRTALMKLRKIAVNLS